MREEGIRMNTLGTKGAQNAADTRLLHESKTTASGNTAYS
jgi:hypothetical protein